MSNNWTYFKNRAKKNISNCPDLGKIIRENIENILTDGGRNVNKLRSGPTSQPSEVC